MSSARAAAVLTWAYVVMFGAPAVPVAYILIDSGRLPSLWGLFVMYGGPWSSRYADERVTGLLLLFLAVTVASAVSAWLLWAERKIGAVLNLALLPVEAVFWIGFALPVPWLFGVARVVLLATAWSSLTAAPGSRD